MHTKIASFVRKALSLILLLSILLFSVGSLSFARAQGEIPLFIAKNIPDKSGTSVQAAIRSRTVGINFSALSGPQGDLGSQALKGTTIQMNLFDDTIYDVVIDSIEASASGGTAWNGHVAGLTLSYAYMVYTEGVFAAHVASLEGVYEVQYSGSDTYTISQLEHSLYPDDIVLEPVLPDNALPAVDADPSAKSITNIDVMVLYTARAVAAVGGIPAMNAKVDLAVQETNQSYVNSNVNQRINLVYAGQIAYNEGTNPDFGMTLDRLTGKVDGHMDNIHALRDAYSADLVSLMIEGTQYCGIAWLMNHISVSFESDAFSVVAQSCATGYYSFAHELGHNMGSRHDTFVDPNNTPFPYSHGFTYPAARWRTIMAYDNACTVVLANCTRLQYWSNPGVTHGGAAMGNANYADNRTSLNNTAATVAAFRVNNGFNKSSPSNGATNQLTSNLSLSWDVSPGAIQYEICYDTVNDNTCNGSWQNEGNATQTTITGLSNNVTYYWQVRANNGSTYLDADEGTWWSFMTIAVALPGAFSKLEPANTATNQSLAPTLLWDQSTGATSYAYCYDTANNNACDSAWISTGTATADTLNNLTAGTTYYWQARATNSSGTTLANANAWWSFTTVAPSTNDDILGATPIHSLPYLDSLNIDGATTDTTDPVLPCGPGSKGYQSVWFRYTPEASGEVVLSTYLSGYNTVLAVWSGTEGNLTNVGCNDNSRGSTSLLTLNMKAGSTYYIEVAKFDTSAPIDYWLNLNLVHVGDDFDAAFPLDPSLPYTATLNTVPYSSFPDDPDFVDCGVVGTNSVWYRFVPSQSGTLNANTVGSDYDTVLGVWSGDRGTLTSLACDDDGAGNLRSDLSIPISAGNTYYIEAAAWGGYLDSDPGQDGKVSQPRNLKPQMPGEDEGEKSGGMLLLNLSWSGVKTYVGGVLGGNYFLPPGSSTRQSYTGINNGPVKIVNTNSDAIIAAERVIYKVNAVNTSFTELMALPNNQLDTVYWLPWYNNVDLDTQLRFANVSTSTATVRIYISGDEMEGSPFTLLAGESTRKSFAGINNGPVKIVSDRNIVAAERVIYTINGARTSFTEMMALPDKQIDNVYWLPWYNNKDLDTQLRIGNVSNLPASVHVYIGGNEMQGSPFTLDAGESTRTSFPGVNTGPVQIVSDHGVPIVAAERVIYTINGVKTSFSEMMALPNSQLDIIYWLPWYNNKDLDTQLRFANVHDSQTASVRVYIGGVEMQGSPFTLLPGESTRRSFAGINDGPVKVESNIPIVAAERLIYKINGVNTSFSEMMGLPEIHLDTLYWLPWYNNLDLDTQLRFGVP